MDIITKIYTGHATPELNCMGHIPYCNLPNFPPTKVSLHMVTAYLITSNDHAPIFNSFTMDTSGLPDVYTWSPRAEDVYIRRTASAHGITTMYHFCVWTMCGRALCNWNLIHKWRCYIYICNYCIRFWVWNVAFILRCSMCSWCWIFDCGFKFILLCVLKQRNKIIVN